MNPLQPPAAHQPSGAASAIPPTGRPLAAVTGASSGIGEAFATQLARDGYDLLLIARRRGRLERLAAQLAAQHGTSVDICAADLAGPGGLAAATARITTSPRIELLVNNAGFAGYGPFAGASPELAAQLIGVHISAPTILTRAALPHMTGRGRGAIINVASLLAFSASLPPGILPHRAVYAAAKAYLIAFTQALASELASTGVQAQACCPGVVATEFHQIAGMDPGQLPVTPMPPADVAAASLTALRLGETICVPSLNDPAILSQHTKTEQQLMLAAAGRPLAARYASSGT